MRPRFTLVPASYVVFLRRSDGQNQILLQLRNGTGYMDGFWATAAAGHIESGESVFEAAAREAHEELGVSNVDLRSLCSMHRTQGEDPNEQRVDYFLQATSWSGEPTAMEPSKCSDLRWFDLRALPDPVVPHELQVLQAIESGNVPPIMTHGF